MKDLREFLGSIGLGKNEVEIYLTLVETGTSSVLDISKKTKIHRSNIYDAIRNLLNEGLVYEVKGEKRLFHARPPENLVDYLKQRQLELEKIVKDFRVRNPQKSDDSTVMLSKGTFALRETLRSLLEQKDDILVYGIPVMASEIVGPMADAFHKERIKLGIRMKHIYNSDSIDRIKYLNKMKLTEAKTFPSKYDSKVTTNVCGDRVIFFIWGEKNGDVTVLEIKNAELSKPYKNYFDVLWSRAKSA